jgi:transposase
MPSRACELTKLGHKVRMMPPAYVKRGKNDAVTRRRSAKS